MLLVWGIGWQQAELQPDFRLHAQADHHRLGNQLQDSAKQSKNQGYRQGGMQQPEPVDAGHWLGGCKEVMPKP